MTASSPISDSPVSVPLRLSALGIPRVVRRGEELSAFARQPLRTALLFYLAVEGRTTRSTLVTVLWPERDESRGRHALSQTLYELRQELGDEVIRTVGEELRIEPGVEVDVREFEEAVEAEEFGRASDLYRGLFLEGAHLCDSREFEGWVDRTRARLARLHRVAQRERIAALVAGGELREALEAARKWASLEPLDDEAQHALIELLARTGSRIEALRRYEAYRERLHEELEVEPLDETRELVTRIRDGAVGSGVGEDEPGPVLGVAGGDAAETADWPSTEAAGSGLEGRVAADLAPDLELVRALGEGAMARVFLAREPALKRLVAVKVLKPELARDPVAVRRFEREAESAARIQHPNVVTVHRIGTLSAGEPYLVMPYIRGGSLAQRLEATGPLEVEDARRVLRQVARALTAAHGIGVVHRDVKPGNVLRDAGGERVLLTDFGIAAILESGEGSSSRLTRDGERVGLARYSSPEQLRGDPLTDRADVYGLGLLAFELVSGRGPFPAEGEMDRIQAQLEEEAPRLGEVREGVDPALDELVARCLRKVPERRPSAEDVVEALLESD